MGIIIIIPSYPVSTVHSLSTRTASAVSGIFAKPNPVTTQLPMWLFCAVWCGGYIVEMSKIR